ncbi:MAG: phage tail tube protein [Desulfovibrionaceae bacterium]|nr:phage tail tube protein [Desulfovibrionaceae bacterium]
MGQAKGYKSKILVDFEDSFKTAPASATSWAMPVNSCAVAGARALTSAQTVTGRRDPVEPDEGNIDVSGQVVIPVDAINMAWWLMAMFGAPDTPTQVVQLTLDAGSAIDKGSGKVGLPCTAHGLAKGAPVLIAGTTNFNGAYTLQNETSADELVVTDTYAAETFDGSETVDLAKQLTLDAGPAVDKGSGKVGLPCTAHGLPVGAEVTIAGTTNYDETYTVGRGTSADELVVTETYSAETFDGSETVTAYFWDLDFSVGDDMPSFLLEKQFPDVSTYLRAKGCKVGGFNLSVGGDGELTASMDVMGAGEDKETSAYDASCLNQPFHRYKQFHASLEEGGAALSSRVKTVNLNIDFGLDGDSYTIGDEGERGDIPEGIMSVGGDIEALFSDATLVDKALDSTESSLALTLTNGGYKLIVTIDELKYARSSPSIEGPKGVLERHTFQGYYGNGANDSCVAVTLRSELKSLTE